MDGTDIFPLTLEKAIEIVKRSGRHVAEPETIDETLDRLWQDVCEVAWRMDDLMKKGARLPPRQALDRSVARLRLTIDRVRETAQ